MNRKTFLQMTVLGTAGLAILPTLSAAPAAQVAPKVVYRLQPLPGKKYSPSFLKFCQRMTFDSAPAAVRRVQDRRHGYLLVAQPV